MATHFFNREEEKIILEAIKEAEKNTSGEIQVHVENRCKKDTMDRAAEVFAMLKMNKTKLRNGVLFYLAVEDKKFAILGDAGINSAVPADFWEKIKNNMQTDFKAGNFAKGLSEGIAEAGKQLKKHFPFSKGDVNELSDDISFGNN
ncbi:MAG: TPM domain-containing protein [Cytophagaceae bacterium]